MGDKIVYNSEELQGLKANYEGIVSNIDVIIEKHINIFESLSEVYNGKSTPIIKEIGKPIEDHLRLLKVCYECCAITLNAADVGMQSTDESLANSLSEQ